MKNKIILVSTILTILSLNILFISCNEDNDVYDKNTIQKKAIVSPNNTNNPYDSIGANHNFHLNNIFSFLYDQYTNPNIIHTDTILLITNNYLLSKYNHTITNEIFNTKIYRCETNQELANKMNAFGFSPKASTYVFALLDTIELISSNSYKNYKNIICYTENNIINDVDINERDKAILLSFTSVLRHSIYYWYEESGAKVAKWLRIALADAKGALTGAGVGAALGSSIPGVGTVGGAITGGAIGATEASVEKAAELDKIEKPQEIKDDKNEN